jgi:hypothetical protein
MIDNKQSTVFIADIKPSRNLQSLSVFIHLTAIGASFVNAIPILIQLVLTTLILANFLMLDGNLKSESRQIKYSEKGGWEIITGKDIDTFELLGSTVISTWVIFLHLNGKAPIIIFYDAMDKKDFRQLIVKLKMTVV